MNKSLSTSDEIWVNKFDEESAQKFRESLMEASKVDPTRPVTIYIDSYGGQVDALAKMIEAMDEVPNPLITVCHGKAMSCGAMLLSHGDIRFVGKNSRVMVHEVSSGTSGDVHDMTADVAETKRLNKLFMGLLAKNCNIKGGYEAIRKMIKSQDGRDRFMDAADAVKFGIADVVGTPRVSGKVIYEVRVTPPKLKLKKSTGKPNPKPEKSAKRIVKGKTDSKR
jgi:ATP-dependent Clp protease protease subunit